MPTDHFDFILGSVIPPSLVLIGVITNTFIIIIYSRKKFKKSATKNIWRLIATVDIFCALQIIKHFSLNTFNYNMFLISPITCKLLCYFSHFGSISAWLLVYISFERLLSITLPHFNKCLQNAQMIIATLITLVNLSFYLQRLVYNDMVSMNGNESYCTVLDRYKEAFNVFTWIDLFIGTVVPFILMILCSVLLIRTIYMTRKRIIHSTTVSAKRKVVRDLKFCVTLVLLDVIFVVLNLPIRVNILVENWIDHTYFMILDDLYYLSFSINFFVYLAVNSEFRKEMCSMFYRRDSRRKEYIS